MNLMPRRTFAEYMQSYSEEHTHPMTRLTHMIGIPMIVASLPLIPAAPPLGIGLFAGGWALQLIGHAVFEKNKPAFASDPYYLLIGPVWVAAEAFEMVTGALPSFARQEAQGETHAEQSTPKLAVDGARK